MDVLIFTETWLNDQFHSSQLFGNGYNVYRNDRDPIRTGRERGGGVLIAISKRYSSSKSVIEDDSGIEQLWVNVNGGSRTICLGVVYIPPDYSTSAAYIDKHIGSALAMSEKLQHQDFHLLFGDYNQPGLCWTPSATGQDYIASVGSTFTAASASLVDGMALLDMKQINPTVNYLNRTLDLIFANSDAVKHCDVIETPEALIDADPFHPPVLVNLGCPPLVRYNDIPEEREFDFYRADYAGLSDALRTTDWSFLDVADVNVAVSLFNQTLTSFLREYVPRPRPKLRPVWSNARLQRLKRKRSAALKKYSRARDVITKRNFSKASNRYRNYNRHLYSTYVLRKQNELKQNPKRFWSFVNDKRKESGLPAQMVLGDHSASTPEDICNLFAQQFSGVFASGRASAQEVQKALQFVPENVCDITITSFTQNEVEDAMKQLKSSVSPGPDGIPSIVLKNCATSLSKPLQMIINQSLRQETFPECWKKSFIFPVFKKGNRADVTNYRGITSLCAGSKLFEILIGGLLQRSVAQYISTDQHGFFPGRSINTNLVEFCSFCLQHMEKGAQVDTVYTDIKAAFDRVDHAILLAKLRHLGASDAFVCWLESFLANRSLSVKLGNAESRVFHCTSGVPQGSNVGPLLFSLYFNDVCLLLPPGCKIVYADDLKIYLEVRTVDDCIKMQKLIDTFYEWCACNLLNISVPKCSVISFSRKKSTIEYLYSINCQQVQRVTVVKDLGVLLDTGLSFHNHYNSIIAKANKNLGFIMRVGKEFRDPYCLRSLYYALVRSILETAAVVWSPYTDIWSARIESIQRKFIRFALRTLPWIDPVVLPPYENRCKLLGLDTLAKRRDDMRAVFVGKLLCGIIDSPNILAKLNLNVTSRVLRSTNFLRLPFHRTVYGQNEPICAMCNIFNSVFHLFDFNVSCETFKCRLRNRNLV